jgi:hypothetical protein
MDIGWYMQVSALCMPYWEASEINRAHMTGLGILRIRIVILVGRMLCAVEKS